MYEKYREKGLAFLSVNVTWDSEGPGRKFVDQYRLPFPVGRDADGKIGTLYGVDATPATLFIGKDGKLADRVDGAPEQVEAIKAGLEVRIEKLLAN
ncbi:MAG: TlpA family protein disulfide reductase [candidate division NC10 bacterium]|nr:TlpA family protein disulfide reductase [candidate division NC10 bacterium]